MSLPLTRFENRQTNGQTNEDHSTSLYATPTRGNHARLESEHVCIHTIYCDGACVRCTISGINSRERVHSRQPPSHSQCVLNSGIHTIEQFLITSDQCSIRQSPEGSSRRSSSGGAGQSEL